MEDDFEHNCCWFAEGPFLDRPKHCLLFEEGFGLAAAHFYRMTEDGFVQQPYTENHSGRRPL